MLCRKIAHITDLQLGDHTLLITANQRLSINLRRALDKQQMQHSSVWTTPQIQPLSNWLSTLWQYHSTMLALSKQEESCLWQNIIREQNEADLLHPQQTAALAQQAWQILHQWQLSPDSLAQYHHDEANLFHTWCQRFQQQCEAHNWISQSEIPARLLKIGTALPENIKAIYLYGFDELTPAVAAWFNALPERIDVQMIHLEKPRAEPQQYHFQYPDDEIQSMANWAKQLYLNNPKQKIGCIVPNLTEMRDKIINVFTETLTPLHMLPGQQQTELIFNLSAGQALTESLIIQHALQVLNLVHHQINTENFYTLLQSPYLAQHDDDIYYGAKLDTILRQFNEPSCPLNALFYAMNKINSQDYPQQTWLTRWRNFMAVIQSLPQKAKPSHWAQHFTQLLEAIGWPGFRAFSSIEYQVLTRWMTALEEFSRLDNVQSQMRFEQALQQWQQLLQNTIFQAEGSDAPIQVLGLLESGGEHFDHLWVMNMTDEIWPPAAMPNPFIPYALQKQYAMPHSSAQREYEYSQQVTDRLLHATQHIVFSYAEYEGDKKCLPSPLIEGEFKHFDHPVEISLLALIHQHQQMEDYTDLQGPALSQTKIKGGSWIIKQQSLCPFRGFTYAQLNAYSPSPVTHGLPAHQRGNLVHAALAEIWQDLRNQERLLKLNEDQLDQLVEASIQQAFKKQNTLASFSAKHSLLKLEALRLKQLLTDWLEDEKQRPAFDVIACEISRKIQVGPLQLNIQIDRIDQLADNTHLIMDYKTGISSTSHWFGERLTDPQLPMYCAFDYTAAMNYRSIVFGEIKAGNKRLKGATHNETLSNRSMLYIENWAEQVAQWKAQIEALAKELEQGHAQVDPIDPKYTCQYCELDGLCRIDAHD